MTSMSRWKQRIATVTLSTMLFGSIFAEAYEYECCYPEPCCDEVCCGSSYAWIGGAILGAAAGAGTGYAAGYNNHRRSGRKGRRGDRGEKGETGKQGPQGTNGFNGQNGFNGPEGPDGPHGSPGCCESCNCCPEPVDICTPLTITVTSAGVDPGYMIDVMIYDPQRLIASGTLPPDSPISVNFNAAEPKLAGTYLIRFVVTASDGDPTTLGTIIFNGVLILTPEAVYQVGDEFLVYCKFCPDECTVISSVDDFARNSTPTH